MAGCCSCVLSPVSVASEMFTGNYKQERARKKTAQLHREGDKKLQKAQQSGPEQKNAEKNDFMFSAV